MPEKAQSKTRNKIFTQSGTGNAKTGCFLHLHTSDPIRSASSGQHFNPYLWEDEEHLPEKKRMLGQIEFNPLSQVKSGPIAMIQQYQISLAV